MASSFFSSRGAPGKVPPTFGDFIINSLEDLTESNFKRFRNKLSEFSYGDKDRIPRGRLEKADCIATKEVLIDTYGEEGALDVTIQVLTLIHLMGPAKKLQERKAQNTEYFALLKSVPGVLGKGPQTTGDLIIYSLEDLKGSDFKSFKYRLPDFSYEDKRCIPLGKLENADCITTKELLIDTYGEEGALDVTIHVFTLIGLMGPANDLQKKKAQHGSAPGVLGKGPQTPGDLIIYSLEDLNGRDFKRFRNKMSDFSHGDKCPIPRGKLENADCIITKNLLIDKYGEEGALDVTIHVFTLIGLMGPANDLQKRRAQNGSAPGVGCKRKTEDMKGCDFNTFNNKLPDFSHGNKRPSPQGRENVGKDFPVDTNRKKGSLSDKIGQMVPTNDLQESRAENGGEHPLDLLWEKLIQRITNVSPVLDHLLQRGLLTDEQYDIVMMKEINQDKMRRLWMFTRGWGNVEKDALHKALKENNPVVMRNLEPPQ